MLAEAIQQVIRVEDATGQAKIDSPYERLKELTRGTGITEESLHDFISGLPLRDEVRDRLLALTPSTYIGVAPVLVDYLGK